MGARLHRRHRIVPSPALSHPGTLPAPTMRTLRPVLLLSLSLALAGAACDDDGGSSEAFCNKLQELTATTSPNGAADTERLARELEDVAPDDIKDDVKVINNGPDEDPRAVEDALTRVSAYIAQRCK